MANQLNILVAGRHAEIVPTVIRLLHNNPEWTAIGTITNEEAISVMKQQSVDLLLLCSGITKEDEQELRQCLARTRPHAVIVQHYGGGSGLLVAEIYEAMASYK